MLHLVFQYLAKRLAGTNVSEMNCFVSSGTSNLNHAISQLRCCCSDDVKVHGFSVIIDMRGSTWHSVKPFLRVLQVCGILS